MTQKEFQEIAGTLPQEPGIYKYFDDAGTLLYVGKAKHIRKRVSSYFTKTLASYKTHELVKRIRRIEFTIVHTEQDAFLLENSLIKQFQPLFNINLKDDKTYPYIVIKNEPFPRIFLTRQKIEDGSQYFGPYTSVGKVRELLNFIKQTIPLRTCPLNLTQRNIEKGKFKVCLEFHLGNCKGPCEAHQSKEDYDENVHQIKNILKGNLSAVIQHFKREMKGYAEALEFEKAETVRKKITYLETYQSRSIVINSTLKDVDAFTIEQIDGIAYVNYLMVNNGAIIQTKTIKVETHLDETPEEILAGTIAQLRTLFNSEAKEIVVPLEIEYNEPETVLTVPKGGDKKKLLELSQKNVQYFIDGIKSKERLQLLHNRDKSEVLLQIKEDLQLPAVPQHIECFDNSNFHGSYPVSAMVCFKDGEPSKKDYRVFNVKTVEGINDFATMKEAVYRRYKRLKEELQAFPQLVIIDGGKGQLSAANEALEELRLQGQMTLVGLAKNEEELFFVGDQESLKLPYDSESHKLIRRIRDEVHRYGLNFHREKRSKGTFKNSLEDIKGIGNNTANILLKTFRSINNIKKQPESELARVVGVSKAKILKNYFEQQKENE
ncbi:excinuclease ABC subunit UvrC [Flavisolibacter ginsenosidimutans]|uniref:UvrABC system protein C n=1 Tax=Flavisolibacter ginsenosidimutans TaxID=661481 RepID=A0A5B8UNG7_9BACT|nr:excinuclease ABC subunit UvrC [Flavisolibacter ginsenosidimutans]QEC57759.1 excinuclease ABC subunit C [Flavisolibacter ginsenosidimutans]